MSLEDVKKSLIKGSCDFPEEFSIDNYPGFRGESQKIFRDGDVVDLGGRKIQIIHTTSHSPGNFCFYEPEKRYLHSEDLIYKGCLYDFYHNIDYKSIKWIQKYNIERVLIGHHELNISTLLISKIE